MKNWLAGAVVAIAAPLSFWSCKEKVNIDLTPTVAIDTTYMGPVEAPQWRRVLIEEFTGVSCSPCPGGHELLDAILASHRNAAAGIDSVSIIGIQPIGIPQAEPVNEGEYHSKHDNRTADGTEIYNSIYGTFGTLPRAGIDRVPVSNALAIAKDFWASTVNSRIKIAAPVNLTLTSAYDAGSRTATIKVRVVYTSTVAKNQNLNLALIENDIYDAQLNGLDIDSMYHHMHVLRDMITSPTGNAIIGDVASKEPGRVYERTFTYAVNADWVPEHCRLIAYVCNNDGADKEVQQCAEIPLK